MMYYQTFLLEQLNQRKKRNPRFSLRAFARSLEISPSQLSNLINGRKRLSLKLASKIFNKLGLDEHESNELVYDLLAARPKVNAIRQQRLLSEDEFNLISDWPHFAVLSLGHLRSNKADHKWIAKRLNIEPARAKEVFFRLQRLGLIEIYKGQFRQTSQPLTTTADIPSSAIRAYHKQCLELAADKLESVPIDQRDFSAITMAVNPEKIKKAKKMINEFKQRICDELEDDDATQVYTFMLQLFPLTDFGGKP